MSENRDATPPAGADEDREREARANRKFSLGEAIGRMAGHDLMKGASPVTRKREAELAIEDYLRRHMTDPGGVLRGVLLRHVGESLLHGDFDYDHPLAPLAACIEHVLGSAQFLEDLVREADAEWGRVFHERPHFQRAGRPPDPDDPYTIDSVRVALSQVSERLAAGET